MIIPIKEIRARVVGVLRLQRQRMAEQGMNDSDDRFAHSIYALAQTLSAPALRWFGRMHRTHRACRSR
jgi:hypothetical protein